MVTAIVLINCEKGMVSQAAQALAEIQGIAEVYSVAGRVDLVAVIRVNKTEDLAEIVTSKLQFITGIEHTETLIGSQVR
jgi:DNA-binding Lrp family transcriptional regulator